MRTLPILVTIVALAGCALQPDAPRQLAPSEFSGTGSAMAKCMQYASQSYCEDEIWGGTP
jgi:hypothetical protein